MDRPIECTACGHGLREGARFCDACGTPLSASAPPSEARKVVTVLFADLVGSTQLQESLDPESARRVIDQFSSAMAAVVAEREGTVVKLMGDGLLAAWGVPLVGEDDAVRAVRAGLAMQRRLEALDERLAREWGVRLRMRVGVNTGEVVVGPDGDVIGDPVNVAARLESAAPPGGVLVGEQTRLLVRDLVTLEAVEPLSLRGKGQRVPAWLATDTAVADRGAAETPFVARAAELARLRAAFDAAVAARESRLVTVIASPGMGKSRLAAEFAATVVGEARVVAGHCERSGQGITLLPVAEVLRTLADITEAAPPETVLAALRSQLGEDDPDADRIVRGAAGVIGVAQAGPPEETFWAVRRLLAAASQDRPLVVVLDDVHWGEPQFLDLVEHLATWTRDAPVLLVALARPELRDVRDALCARGPLVLDVVELTALDADASRALVAGILGGDGELPAALAERVVEATGGNPLFLGETLRMLVGDGVLHRNGGAWVVDSEDIDVPPTIHALLAARLERLATGERHVVERASVIGTSFPRGGVQALLAPEQEVSLADRLDALHRHELVEPEGTFFVDEPVFRFHHVLIRDAAYRALLKESRADLHERFAAWLVNKAGERIGEHEEMVAYHLEQAHDYRRQLGPLDDRGETLGTRAAERLSSSGRRALAREDLAAAANLLERAAERGGEDTGILVDLVEVYLSSGDATAAETALDRLDLLAGREQRLRARVAVAGVELGRLTGEIGLRDAERELAAAAEVLSAAGDDAGHAKALELLARSIAPLGRIAEAEAVLDQALAVARRADDARRVTAVLSTAPIVALYGPSPVPRASGRCLDVVRILRMGHGNRHVEARALRCQAVLEAMRGRADAARTILAGARATFEELGLRLDLLELGQFDAMVELLLGDPQAAERGLRQTAAGLDEIGAGGALAHALMGRALVDQGRNDEAIVASGEAETRAGDDLQATALWMRVRAEALAGCGELGPAEELARRAIALGETTDALADHADCRLALARVLRHAGREDEATAEATLAAELYEAKGHDVGVGRARALGAITPPTSPEPEPTGIAVGTATAAAGATSAAEPLASVHLRQAVAAITDRDWDAYARLFAPGFRGSDHRRALTQPVVSGAAEAVAAVRGMFSPDAWVEAEELLADDRVTLHRVRLVGSGPGDVGTFEAEWLSVVLLGNSRMIRSEAFDLVDRDQAMARARELMRTPTAELLFREFVAFLRERNWDALARLYREDYEFADRRLLGWEALDRDGIVLAARSVDEQYPDLDVDVEVLDADDRAFLLRSRWHGHAADGGGEVEYLLLETGSQEDGFLVRWDWFPPEQEAEARARLAELRGESATGGGDTASERLMRRALANMGARDWAAHVPLHAPGFKVSDLRKGARQPTIWGVEDAVASLRAIFSRDAAIEAHTLLADDRVILQRMRLTGSGPGNAGWFEAEWLYLALLDGDLMLRMEAFDVEDESAARERYATYQRTPNAELLLHECFEFIRARDWDGMPALYSADLALNDRRLLAWGPLDRDGWVTSARSVMEQYPDLDSDVEILDADDAFVLLRTHWHGHALDGGGAVEYDLIEVGAQRGGLVVSLDWYSAGQEPEARARLAELRGETTAGGIAAQASAAVATGGRAAKKPSS